MNDLKICSKCKINKSRKDFYTNRGKIKSCCKLCSNIINAKYRNNPEHRKRKNERKNEKHLMLKIAAFKVYGGCKCQWCGDEDMLVLSLDHINNDGYKHRKYIGSGLYYWLKKNNYPPGFQTLCMSCNFAKRMNKGVLPLHRKDTFRK